VAQRLGVYKPIGDELLLMLRNLRRESDDIYNTPMDSDFRENGRWESPLFVAVRFFEIMVSRSLYQNVRWHMWLFYLRDAVGEAVTNYDPYGTDYNADAEFPTRYSYLLYTIFDALIDWIEPVTELPKENVQLDAVSASHENDNIPKSAIRALVEAHRMLLAADRIETKFKCYISRMIFDLYFDLIEGGASDYAETLMICLRSPHIYPRIQGNYTEQLRRCYEDFDTIPHLGHTERFERDLFGA